MSWVLLCLLVVALFQFPSARIRGATGSDAARAAAIAMVHALCWAAVCLGLLAGALHSAGHL